MSTKGTVAFTTHDGEVMAAVYLHNAGKADAEYFAEFFDQVIRAGSSARDYRFWDPTCLAAKLVAWSLAGSLAFGDVGVITDPSRWHANRRFTVRCHAEPSATYPEVTEDGQPLAVAAPAPLPHVFNSQAVGANGLGQVIVAMPQQVMSRADALTHAAYLVLVADRSGEEFPRYLQAVAGAEGTDGTALPEGATTGQRAAAAATASLGDKR